MIPPQLPPRPLRAHTAHDTQTQVAESAKELNDICAASRHLFRRLPHDQIENMGQVLPASYACLLFLPRLLFLPLIPATPLIPASYSCHACPSSLSPLFPLGASGI
jgi:hypothetical protein